MNTLKAAVTIALIIAFGALIIFLLSEVSSSQSEWERYVYLLSGVEAVVFAAVGWMFGKEVHREQAEKAENRASQATQSHIEATAAAATEHERGLALGRAILAHHTTAPQPAAHEQRLTTMGTTAPDPLLQLAKETYPELGAQQPS